MTTKLLKENLPLIKSMLPYGYLDSWEDLDLSPQLYHGVHIYWLKFYGMWYNERSPRSVYFWLQMLYTVVVLWLVCFLPGIGEVVYLLRRGDNVGDIAAGLYLFLSEMYTYFKIAVFWWNKNKILNLLQYLNNAEFKPVEMEHKRIVRESIKNARSIMTNYTTMCVCAVSVGIFMPMTEHFDVLPTNVEYPYFDVYKSPAYEMIYLNHIYYKPATCIIDGAMDTMLAAFIASAIGQIEILAFNLRNLDVLAQRQHARAVVRKETLYPEKHYMTNVIRGCIIHHTSIIRYVSLIESAFSLASALQFMLSVMVLCLVGVQFLSIEDPKSHPLQLMWTIIYLSCMLCEVFILCWFGNELIWKSTELRQAAFDGPWLQLDTSSAKFIIIFLERCQRPLAVTAGKIFTLSLVTYTVLINWAYKAFALMSKMKK